MDIGGPVEFGDLEREVLEFKQTYNLREDDAFVMWFLRAYVVDDDNDAKTALTDDSGERAVDAVHIDDSARVVHLLQGKFHGAIGKATDKAESVAEFTSWARVLYGTNEEFHEAIDGAS